MAGGCSNGSPRHRLGNRADPTIWLAGTARGLQARRLDEGRGGVPDKGRTSGPESRAQINVPERLLCEGEQVRHQQAVVAQSTCSKNHH